MGKNYNGISQLVASCKYNQATGTVEFESFSKYYHTEIPKKSLFKETNVTL